jgi:hypothetical protein
VREIGDNRQRGILEKARGYAGSAGDFTLARSLQHHFDDEPERDAWSETWGDRALQNLGRWLEGEGLADEQAALVVEQTWLFYSYVILPTLREHVPMGIASRRAGDLPEIALFLFPGSRETPVEQVSGGQESETIRDTFTRHVQGPLADCVAIRLHFLDESPRFMIGEPSAPKRNEARFRSFVKRQQLTVIGIFVDDLRAELQTIMDPQLVPVWLNMPNGVFSGRKPIDLLDEPTDRQLRDLITRAKFNLPAA